MSDGATTNWYDGIDAEIMGHAQTKGWDLKDPKVAFSAAVQAYKGVEKQIGIPADQIARIPKDAADPGWSDLWQRLGAPKDAAEYKFDAVKFRDGSPIEDTVAEKFRSFAAANHLPASTASAFAQFIADLADEDAASAATEAAARLGAEEATLKRNWGTSYDTNVFLAQKAVDALGLPKDLFEVIRDHSGYAAAMDAFRSLGVRMGEAEFLGGGANRPGGSTAGMTRDQAVDRLATLKNDQAWVDRWMKGDAAAAKEFQDLTKIVVGPAPSR